MATRLHRWPSDFKRDRTKTYDWECCLHPHGVIVKYQRYQKIIIKSANQK